MTNISFPPLSYINQPLKYANDSVNKERKTASEVSFARPSVSQGNQSTKVTISEEALRRFGETQKKDNSLNKDQITPEEAGEIKKLAARDQEVRDHERAHMMAGGALVKRGASYQYTTGPDGKRYAVAGEVTIDSSVVSDNPQATITKMQQVRRAALAPAEPSAQDRSVATSASQKEAQARQELRQKGLEET